MIRVFLFHLALIPFLSLIFLRGKVNKESKTLEYYRSSFIFILLPILVYIFQLIEVNFIDVKIKYDLTKIISFEFPVWNTLLSILPRLWHTPLLQFFFFVYIILFSLISYFIPFVFLITEKTLFKRLSFSIAILYLFAIPFFIFLPITNVYTFFKLDSPLNMVLPDIEKGYYHLTTRNNCFPSLHVALPLLLLLFSLSHKDRSLRIFLIVYSLLIAVSVIFLAIHWITDVIGGVIFSFIAYKLANRIIKK